jgi:hypothetical protein
MDFQEQQSQITAMYQVHEAPYFDLPLLQFHVLLILIFQLILLMFQLEVFWVVIYVKYLQVV